MPRAARSITTLAALAALALLGLASPAQAAIEGEVHVDLLSLEEATLEADLELTDEQADELRARADRDDDGEVGSLEAAGAGEVLADRFEGETEAYALDGNPYTVEGASVDTEDLQGDTNRSVPVGLTVEAEAHVSPGSAPHTFAVDGLLAGVSGETLVAHTVRAPGGYEIGDTDGFAQEGDCRASTDPGTEQASLTFETGDACSRESPLLAAPIVVGVVAGAAALWRDRHAR